MFENRQFGSFLKLSVEGASHAPCIGFSLGNFPAGFRVDADALAAFMRRRAPGRSAMSTPRREDDDVEFTSGVEGGVTTGGTIRGRIANRDARPADYGARRTVPRPGHADFPQWVEAGAIPTGGGANSGRLTAALCAAGGLCMQLLGRRGVSVSARIESIGGRTDGFSETVAAAAECGDSVGGTIVCEARGLPAGMGGALFAGIETELGGALFAIPGVKGVEFGNGFAASSLRGSENNDEFVVEGGVVKTATNRHGGLLGGRTSGMPLVFRIAVKPTPTIFKAQRSVDLEKMSPAECRPKGRHDPCIVPRAVPVAEAVAAFVLADAILAAEAATPRICMVLTGRTLEEDAAQLAAQRYFADMAELRADLLDAAERGAVADFAKKAGVPVILTFRRKRDGGAFGGDEAERERFFKDVLRPGCAFAYVDFEDDFRHPALSEAAARAGVGVIRSLHDFSGPVSDIAETCRRMRGGTREIPKVAFMPRTLGDVTRLFEETARFTDIPHIVCAMGAAGLVSRTLASRTHSMLVFASSGGLASLGHVSPRELVETFRFRSVTPSTRLFGVTGFPLVFTRSPAINNAAFAAAAEDAVMAQFPAETAEDAVRFMNAAGLDGMAVTYPHKRAIMPLLDEVDEGARRIGAVNTVVREGGRLVGYNTDADGFREAFEAFLGEGGLAGRRVAVVGAGGAARSVVHALSKMGAAEVCVFNRTPERAKALADEFGFESAALCVEEEARLSRYGQVIVQCASPGGEPERFDPLAFHRFCGGECVYDLVYEPQVTPTMARAIAAGGRAENGFSMLLAQARLQRDLFAIGAA